MTHHALAAVKLKAVDGHVLDAVRAEPVGRPRGGVVIVQEIFGVTRHIRDVVHQYADAGYAAIAPALFDRIERGVDLPYDDYAPGRALRDRVRPEHALLDLKAAIDAVAPAGKVAVVGYCWGGSLAYLAACHLPLACAIAYYGGQIVKLLERTPKCPVMFHFGERDTLIPPVDVERIKQAYPLGHYYVYPADHGFNCTDRAQHDAQAARLAFDRSLDFLHRHVG
ncbi:MAG: dienelactone hydrolase family protein [Steroidobacteraceae bacterium]|jgi:carboxymethylenebutenolidase|nr:dienelactone hydrolase family protein [Steroidobacteraceae bacterium]